MSMLSCLINNCDQYGAGMYISESRSVKITNTSFAEDSAGFGGAVYLSWVTTMIIVNVNLTRNNASMR